ncbi:hypothetical protein ANCCEY_15691, partial [Ancylostoma ceylanicum]
HLRIGRHYVSTCATHFGVVKMNFTITLGGQTVTNITETFPLQPGQTADSLVVAVERSVQQFLDQGDAAIRSCPLAHGTALETLTDALVDVRDT